MASSDPQRFHVLIACGGTGGHLFPGIAVGEALQAQGHGVTLLISEKKIDSLAASNHKGMNFVKLPYLAMPKPWSPKMPGFLLGVYRGLNQCKKLIKEQNTQAVLGMGGFTSFAPILAGRQMKIKTLIHDSNAIPGKANKLTARFADAVLLGFEACAASFPKQKTVRITGTPVRSALRQAAKENRDDPYDFFGLNPDMKTLLIMGGSQGARGVNQAVAQSLNHLTGMGVQILHITGPADYQTVSDSYQGKEMRQHAHIAAFCHRMELAYAIADLALARSGASTLAELAYFGVPSLLVPYPFAADDHQTKNALIFHEAGAALMIKENDLSAEKLAFTVNDLLRDTKKHATMKRACKALAHPDAAENIAGTIEEIVP